MGNTVFYKKAEMDNPEIGWKDILGESFKKHSMKELEYALSAGSVYDTATPETMLKKWHKPWVWTRVLMLLGGVGLVLWLMYQILGQNDINGYCTLLVLTCVTPISSMVLFWELNVARNVSIFELIGCFLIGMILSFLFTDLIDQSGIVSSLITSITQTERGSWMAPFSEEPAKFLAALVILMYFAKNGKSIWGCTGIAVGAGVGTGFTLFESLGYVFRNTMRAVAELRTPEIAFPVGMEVVLARSFPKFNGHMLMCVPYSAMLAYNYHRTKNWKGSILDKKTILMLLASGSLHAFWNSDFNGSIITQTALTVGYVFCNLYAIRLCFQQAVREGSYTSGQGMALGQREKTQAGDNRSGGSVGVLRVASVGSALKGAVWQYADTTLIGKTEACTIRLPADTPELSRVHCRLTRYSGYWTICDMGSSYGTQLNGRMLLPNTEYKLRSGSVVTLGSPTVTLRLDIV